MPKMIDIVMPDSDQEGTESMMERWFKQVGDAVTENEPILEISTDKVSMEVSAPASGVLREILKDTNESIEPGEVLGRIEVGAEAGAPAGDDAGDSDGASTTRRRRERSGRSAAPGGEPRLSPVVRRMIDEHGIDPAELSGSGRGGRITAEDVQAYLDRQGSVPPAAEKQSGAIPSRRVPHSTTRLRTAKHMVESMLHTAPHVTAVFDADFSAVAAHRKANKAAFEADGVKLTYTAYVVMAAVAALREVPEANSRWHDDALEIFEPCHIGIAAATDQGLLVPVLHDAQDLDLKGIARKLQDITGRARSGDLTQGDMRNGTFTITNHGMTGSLIATPIIHQPQSAILGVGKLEKRVVVVEKDGKDVSDIRPMAYVTLTIDHRVLDGFQANRFLTRFVAALGDWV